MPNLLKNIAKKVPSVRSAKQKAMTNIVSLLKIFIYLIYPLEYKISV